MRRASSYPLQLDLDDFNVENAYFRSFDLIVRRQLDPVWHKVGPQTKQLVNDLAVLRRLLRYGPLRSCRPHSCPPSYLLTYDPLAFHAYLETLVAANSGSSKQHHPPWMLTDAANVIFQSAKRRCYTLSAAQPPVIELDPADDPEGWAVLDEAEGIVGVRVPDAREVPRARWLPKGMDPVLEELPKWGLLAEVLQEIEEEMIRMEMSKSVPPGEWRLVGPAPRLMRGCRRSWDEHGADHDVVVADVQPRERVLSEPGRRCAAGRAGPPHDGAQAEAVPLVEVEDERAQGRRARCSAHAAREQAHGRRGTERGAEEEGP